MIKSMTGFGRGEHSDGKRAVTVEIKSVNHRYCDISIRMPRRYMFAEEAIKISQRANQRLIGRWGVRIAYLDLDCMNALCWNRATAYQAECPECGELNWVEKENRKAFICTE